MKNLIIESIDIIVRDIKMKYESNGITAADMFIIFVFEILRCEILMKSLSDNTISALMEIASTTSHFYYFRDHPTLYKNIQQVYIQVSKVDKRFNDADFEKSVNFELNSWIKCVSESSTSILKKLPMSYFV